MDQRAGEIVDELGSGLPGSQVTSLLLEVMRRRVDGVTPADVLRRFADDRFVASSPATPDTLRRVRQAIVAAYPAGTIAVELSPLVPLGTHHAVAGVDQYRLVSTVRGTEVAADPTVGLALEVVSHRRSRTPPRPRVSVTMATFQRVTRGQLFDGPRSFAHFELSGLVTGGRDTGHRAFELEAVANHVEHAVSALVALGATSTVVRLSDFTGGRLGDVVGAVAGRWSAVDGVEIIEEPRRTRARRYYTDLAMAVETTIGGHTIEVGDGGLVDWSQRLGADRKERLMTSGLSVERLALVIA